MTSSRISAASANVDGDDLDIGFTREQCTSATWFEHEMAKLFRPNWQYAGHVSEIPRPGDWITAEILTEPLVLTRDEDGGIHALFNVCRHRGALMCEPGRGSGNRLVCPYHQWSYALDGSLRVAPAMPGDLPLGQYSLRKVPAETWNGFVFVNLGGAPSASVADLARDQETQFAPFGLAGAKVAATIGYDVGANWKVVYENFLECYHCAVNHPEFTRVFDLRRFFQPASAGEPYPLVDGARSLTTTGEFVSRKLLGSFGTTPPAPGSGDSVPCALAAPSLGSAFLAFPDYAIVFEFRPVAPERTVVRCDWLVAGDAQEKIDYEVSDLTHLWDVTNRQDWELCERTQAGIRAGGYVPGPRNPDREPAVATFTRNYRELMAAGNVPLDGH
ncbi:aromatic ring-hydroxylating oxygenase subunit alpha [Amycolatopsis jejuensis]|uniref:aromatic ring-hydroxylating oxygenase subunit alpha n=1 Tax=Amycolatopsis jejuensis TaxID=330084 RepID=UPI000524DCF2|nr:aromatic ring-hydroxylating dioxygenase subunit alpha [Amycolatopsis jejuensis]